MDNRDYQAALRTVTTPHGEFAYIDVGEGPVALFVHGLFVSAYIWRQVIAELRDERRCIAYNLPQHGGSRVADDADLSLAANAEMLASFCAALGLDQVESSPTTPAAPSARRWPCVAPTSSARSP